VISAAMLNSFDDADNVSEIISDDYVTILLTYLLLNYFHNFE